MPSVTINWKTGDTKNDRHIGRYRRCLYEMIKELKEHPFENVHDVFTRYNVTLLDDYKVGLEFPSDFDQSVLPKELR